MTYSTVDCAVFNSATTTSACAALGAKTALQYPGMVISGCSGACGSLVLQLGIDGSVADATIVAAAAAIAADLSSVAIALATTDGAVLNLSPSAVMVQGVAASSAATVTGKKGKKGKKGVKGNEGKKGQKGGKGKASKGKGKRPKFAKQAVAETARPRTHSHPALIAGILGVVGVVGVVIGLKKSATGAPESVEPTEKSPLVAKPVPALLAPQQAGAADDAV